MFIYLIWWFIYFIVDELISLLLQAMCMFQCLYAFNLCICECKHMWDEKWTYIFIVQGLVPWTKLLLTIGRNFFLSFWPLILSTIASFSALYLVSSRFFHSWILTFGSPLTKNSLLSWAVLSLKLLQKKNKIDYVFSFSYCI